MWLLLATSQAFAASSLIHDLATNAINPLPAGSCLLVDQNSTDAKLCSNWATAFGALLPSLSNLTATALPSGFTIPSPTLTGTVAGANTIPYAILSQATARTILGNTATSTANITAGWTVSGDASKLATTTGSLTDGHCVNIDALGNLTDAGAACSSGGGGGSVTSVGLSVPASSILGVTSSPVVGAGTIALSTTGTSGGIPYFSSGTQLSSSAQMPANHAITGGGAGASPKDSKVTITIPATGSTLTIADGKTLTATNSLTLNGGDGKVFTLLNTLTFAGTDGTTQTFQATDTILGRATTDTLTNKTYDTAGTGNVFKIAGAQLTAISGTGSTVALTASPTFTGTITAGAITDNTSGSGAYSGAGPYIFAISESYTMTGFVAPFVVQDTMTSGGTGNRIALTANMRTGFGAVGSFLQAIGGEGRLTGTGSGNIFGIGMVAASDAGVAATANVVGAEFDVQILGAAVNDKIGVLAADVCTSAGVGCSVGVGAIRDAGFLVSTQNTAVGFLNGYMVGSTIAGDIGVKASGNLFNTAAITVTNGIHLTNATFTGKAFDSTGFSIDPSGNAIVAKLTSTGLVIVNGYTVAGLPAGVIGAHAYVTNAVACTFLAAVVNGGAVVCPVFYDGVSWKGG